MKTPAVVYALVTCGYLIGGPTKSAFSQEWSVDLHDVTDESPADYHRAESVAFVPGSNVVATAGLFHDSVTQAPTGEIRLFSIETGRVERVLTGTCDTYAPARGGMLAVAPDGKLIAAAGSQITDGRWSHFIEVFDLATGRLVSTFPGTAGHPRNSLAFTSDSQRVVTVTAADDGVVRFIEARTGKVIRTHQTNKAGAWSIAFAPRHDIFATGNEDDTISLWDSRSGVRLAHTARSDAGPPRDPGRSTALSVALSTDGRLLAAGAALWKVQIEGAGTAAPHVVLERLAELPGHTGATYSVALSPDGSRLASACHDQTCRVWDIATRKPLATLEHNDSVYDVAFSPDGRHLASLGRDALKCWRVDKIAAAAQP